VPVAGGEGGYRPLMNAIPDIPAAAVRQLVELVDTLASEVRDLRAELAASRVASPWMTSDEAAAWLKVSRDTLDKYSASHGHEEGGPVNVGEVRKTLRWNRTTIDAWFRRAAGIAAPKAKRRASPTPAPRAVATAGRFDWSKV
jgi:hypothetical protein